MESVHLEQEVLKETVGSQDQVLAAYGGFNHITFPPNGEISVRPVTLSRGAHAGAERSRHALLHRDQAHGVDDRRDLRESTSTTSGASSGS